jgi:uncharacterized protein (DUF362 family)
MKTSSQSRRVFLRQTLALAAGAPVGLRCAAAELAAPLLPDQGISNTRYDAKVAITQCKGYGPEVRAAMAKCFDLLGGIGSLVKNKTVAVKLNLTGTDFSPFLGRPAGETFMTHYSTALALGSLLFAAGARRVRFLESTQSRAELAGSLALADWDVKALEALGSVEFENTRNLGSGKKYAHLTVPGGGYMFSALDLNHSYADADVFVSLAKLKNHITAGVTLSMKNCFGLTPNSLYGAEAGNEDAQAGRSPLHNPRGFDKIQLPGLKPGITSTDPTWRVPRIVADVCGARPIDLAIIDGITATTGGEGPWCRDAAEMKFTAPGVLIAGLNPVSTDAVGTAVMGYGNPRAERGTKPFGVCDNHLLLAEKKGLGIADPAKIDVRGMTIAEAKHPYD